MIGPPDANLAGGGTGSGPFRAGADHENDTSRSVTEVQRRVAGAAGEGTLVLLMLDLYPHKKRIHEQRGNARV